MPPPPASPDKAAALVSASSLASEPGARGGRGCTWPACWSAAEELDRGGHDARPPASRWTTGPDRAPPAARRAAGPAAPLPRGGSRPSRACCDCNPSHGPAHFELGQLLWRKGLAPEAAAHFTKSLEYQPENGRVYYYLAEALNLMGDLAGAERGAGSCTRGHPEGRQGLPPARAGARPAGPAGRGARDVSAEPRAAGPVITVVVDDLASLRVDARAAARRTNRSSRWPPPPSRLDSGRASDSPISAGSAPRSRRARRWSPAAAISRRHS